MMKAKEKKNTAETKLSFKEAYVLIGGLSKTSKMPWYSYSLPAEECITGTKLRQVENSTCSSCYACKGRYRFGNIQKALYRRFDSINDPQWVEAFTTVLNHKYRIARKKENRFRWHDSGDIMSVKHLRDINQIAKNTKQLTHWLPTRENAIVAEFLKGETKADNLLIRISATMIGQDYKKAPLGLPYSTVGVKSKNVQECKAYTQGGKCLDCNMCWNPELNVNYPLH